VLVLIAGLTECVVDPVTRTARVGAGVRRQTVLDAATPHGLAPLCGSAPAVGVVGFLTGGGIGPLLRTVGLSAGPVQAVELVTGAGDVLRVAPEEHAGLFWGVRGGKSMLGDRRGDRPAADRRVLRRRSLLRRCARRGGDGQWQRWTADLPDTVNTSFCIQQLPPLLGIPEPLAGRMTVAVRYTALGDVAEAQRLLQPMREVAPQVVDAVGVLPYAAIARCTTTRWTRCPPTRATPCWAS
jgi:FAD binding domain-containing protein